jgi:hypothetical protein
MTNTDPQDTTGCAWFIIIALIMGGAWIFGSCQRNVTLRNCGRYAGQYIYSWRGTNQIACVTYKGSYDNLEIVTPNGSGEGRFWGNYVLGEAGGKSVRCAGRNITGLSYGICTD